MEPKVAKNLYTCSACGKPAELKDGKVVRECEHSTAAIHANVSARAVGAGGVKNGK